MGVSRKVPHGIFVSSVHAASFGTAVGSDGGEFGSGGKAFVFDPQRTNTLQRAQIIRLAVGWKLACRESAGISSVRVPEQK
jgi:hypothetical protein